MTTAKEVMGRLNAYDPNEVVAVAIWCVEDVLERAKERGINISRGQAEKILDEIDKKQDASLGISWDTLDVYIDGSEKSCPKCGKGISEFVNWSREWVKYWFDGDYICGGDSHPDDGSDGNEYCCPECGEVLFRDEDEARKFLKKEVHP